MTMIDYEKLVTWETTDTVLENSFSIFTSAKNIAMDGKYGLATSLMVLSREEAQKSLLMAFACSGFYDIKNPEIVEELDQCFRLHKYKIASSWLVNAFVLYIISSFQAALLGQNPNPEAVDNLRQTIQQNIELLRKQATSGTVQLDMLKQAGFYVGPVRTGEWMSPSMFSQDAYSKMENATNNHLLVVRFAVGLLKSGQIPKDWRRAAQKFRKIISERPRDPMLLETLEKTGQLGKILADFWRFLQVTNLLEAYESGHRLPEPKS